MWPPGLLITAYDQSSARNADCGEIQSAEGESVEQQQVRIWFTRAVLGAVAPGATYGATMIRRTVVTNQNSEVAIDSSAKAI